MTALVIITTKANQILDAAGDKLSGADLSIAAFNTGIAGSGVVVTDPHARNTTHMCA